MGWQHNLLLSFLSQLCSFSFVFYHPRVRAAAVAMATVTHLGQDGRVIDVGGTGWEWWRVRAKREGSGINIATLALGFISRAAARFAVKLKKGQAGGGVGGMGMG